MLKFSANSRWQPPNRKYIYLRVRSTNELATKFQRLCFVLGVPDSTVLYASSPEVIFCCKSKMAAAKPEILLYQRSDELEMKFQRLYPCFLECPTRLFYRRKLFLAANPRWRPENRNSFHF